MPNNHTQEMKELANKNFDLEFDWFVNNAEMKVIDCPALTKEIKLFLDTLIDKVTEKEREMIVEIVVNAGQNKISMLDPETPRCELCHNGFTGTYWISQNDLIFSLTGKYLSEYKENLIKHTNE